ncbi:MAG: sodium-dependent transporter [Acidobacteria bacterium]|nr:sodium-dependent transporter [Acidobacteriota bacterium]
MAGDAVTERGNWGSKMAFIFAASGSAIGLGSIWRFPLYVGRHGGAVFVLTYIIAVIFIGFTVMLAELAIGRHTQSNPVGAYKFIKPNSQWKLLGYLGVVTGVFILSYYSVIAGWAAGYLYKTVIGAFRHLGAMGGAETWATSDRIFKKFAADPLQMIICLFVIIFLTSFVISRGVKSGIERWSKILMPFLFALIVFLAIRALTLPGAGKGLAFFLNPDFSKMTPAVILNAVGQAFFSLSLGMGTMLTYGSYISKKDNLVTSAGWVCFSTTLIAVLAGFIIFPTLFATPGLSPETFEAETGLMFQVLPITISKLPGGYVFGILFFILLLIAALTSTISMLEVPTAFLVDERKWSRKKAAVIIGIVAFFFGIPAALSNGGVKILTKWNLMVRMDQVFGTIALAVGALLISIFVAYVWKAKNAAGEIMLGNTSFRIRPVWMFCIRFVAPVTILIVLVIIVYGLF